MLGVVERKGRIVARVTAELTIAASSALVKEYVLPETMIYTDEAPGFRAVGRLEGMGLRAQAHQSLAKGLRDWRRSHEHD